MRCLVALAGDYRLMHKVARKAIAEHEFSCADRPNPAFLLRSRLGSGGAAAVSSCCFFGSFRASSSPCSSWHGAMAAKEEDEVMETEGDDEGDDEALANNDGDEDGWWLQCGELLDDRAEEFVDMFYEQLRAQRFAAVFQGSSPCTRRGDQVFV